jgi:putative ABC transport system substrate-binding protein
LTVEDNPGSAASIREIQAAAGALGLVVTVASVRQPYNFDSAFSGIVRDRAEGVIVQSIAAYFGDRKRIADLALKHRPPSIGSRKEYADAGLLLSYGASYPELFRRVAVFVDKILKGAKPADLPFEQPTKFELVVNLKTAKALGIKVPQSIVVQAEHVIQ